MSPIKTALILTSFCGFFHAFGIWLLFCQSEGTIDSDNVILAIFFSAIFGIFGAIAYFIISYIFHGAFGIIRSVYKSTKGSCSEEGV
jgi:hypothetical protein